jgi:hypothetical protein
MVLQFAATVEAESSHATHDALNLSHPQPNSETPLQKWEKIDVD